MGGRERPLAGTRRLTFKACSGFSSVAMAIIGVWFVYSWCYYYQISETRLFESILLWNQIIVALLSQLMKAIIHLMRDDARNTPSTEELLNLYGKIGFRSSLTSGGLSKTSFTSISRHASKGSIGKCDFV